LGDQPNAAASSISDDEPDACMRGECYNYSIVMVQRLMYVNALNMQTRYKLSHRVAEFLKPAGASYVYLLTFCSELDRRELAVVKFLFSNVRRQRHPMVVEKPDDSGKRTMSRTTSFSLCQRQQSFTRSIH
jgi:hypothetical protein